MEKSQFRDALAELTGDRVHGASEIARMALQFAADSALHCPARDAAALLETLRLRSEELALQRPSMAPLANLMGRWRQRLAQVSTDDLEDFRWQAAEAATELVRESRNAVREVASRTREFVGEGKTIITHSFSSTVVEVFHQLKESGVRAIITESRPLLLGHKLATILSGWSIPTTLISEGQMGLFVRQADIALVGADSLLADGSVINNAGTYLLALAAHDQGVPFHVACESFKWRSAEMGEPVLEEMPATELGAPRLEHVTVANIYFDITPAWLVTGWITEHGVPPDRIATDR